jgi:hypothetical protein
VGKAKQSKDYKIYQLNEKEYNYLKLLNIALMYSILKDKLISGYLYQICHLRFGYKADQNLIFEIDLENDKQELKVTEVPDQAIGEALEKIKKPE